jgi:hypothetical protein
MDVPLSTKETIMRITRAEFFVMFLALVALALFTCATPVSAAEAPKAQATKHPTVVDKIFEHVEKHRYKGPLKQRTYIV